ncbi:MAG: hypothetical protein ACRECZ_06300 [Methylocella sp.]
MPQGHDLSDVRLAEASPLLERFSREAKGDPKGRSCEYRETGEALNDRAESIPQAEFSEGSFCRFCGFARDEATPERTAFVRFRRQLVEHGLDCSLFEVIARDLGSKGATIRNDTIIHATVIGLAGKGDEEAA